MLKMIMPSPLRICFTTAITLLLGTGALLFVDQSAALILSRVSPLVFHFFAIITDIASPAPFMIISLLGILFNKSIHSRWGLSVLPSCQFALTSLVAGSVASHALKIAIGRRRPFEELDFSPWIFSPPNFQWEFQSLPSGHTQVAFTLATIGACLAPRYRFYFWGFGALIGLSRIVLGVHFLSDIFFGALVGWAVTLICWSHFQSFHSEAKPLSPSKSLAPPSKKK